MADNNFIGRYRMIRRLGSGAFADVFLAVDDDLESPVAIKVLAERWALDPDVRERFLNEARLLRRLGGERLVSVHDIGQTPDGRPYFVMPYADRGTLEERLADLAAAGRVVPPEAAFAAARAVALALRAVHEAGVVHRDVKPGNVLIFSGPGDGGDAAPLLAADERLVLGDFGLAKDLSDGGTALSLPVGTPGYMAPEQSDAGAAVDQRADVYACTALLTRILAGRLPSGGAVEESLSGGSVGPAVRRALLSGLDPTPARRPASAGQWLSDLDRAVAADRKPGRLVPMLAAALVVAVGVAAAVLVAWPRPSEPAAAPPPLALTIAFEEVFDDTRSISLRVPATWSQRWGNGWHPGQSPFYGKVNVGPGLNASPNVSDWFTEAAVPGVFAGVSSRVVKQAKFSPEFMRQYFGPNGCTAAATGPFRLDRLGLTGVQGEWSCPEGIRWRFAYGWPAHHRYLVALEIKLVTAGDDRAWTEALASVAVHTEPPNG